MQCGKFLTAILAVTVPAGLVLALLLTVNCTPTQDGKPHDEWGDVELVETLRIGELDGADEYLFGSINDIAVGPDGSIYVSDRQLVQVRQYDADGNYVRDIGRKGEGPGEYFGLLGLEVTSDGTVAILSHRITLYTPEGEYVRDFPVQIGYGGPPIFDSDLDGNFYARALAENPRMGEEWKFELLMVSPDGDVLAHIPEPMEHAADTHGVLYTSEGPSYYFVTSTRHAWSPLGYFVVGRNDAYAIELRDTTGVIGRFEHEHTPVEFTSEERKQWKTWAKFAWKNSPEDLPAIPDVKPVFRDIEVGDDGRIWVRRHVEAEKRDVPPRAEGDDRPPLEWLERATYDVFEPEGAFLGTVVLPPNTWIAARRGRELWGIERTDEGEQVVRFEVQSREGDDQLP